MTLNGAASSDPDGTIVSYVWTENDVEIATGVNPQVTLAVGIHTITLTVTDDDGATDSGEVVIIINPPATSTVLDDFNRSDGAVGSNWSGDTGSYGIVGNQLGKIRAQTSETITNAIAWSPDGSMIAVGGGLEWCQPNNPDSSFLFVKLPNEITSVDIEEQVQLYRPNYSSVLQPVLRREFDRKTGVLTGYLWTTRVFQQTDDMRHFPR